jgi:hypothetical protein
MWEIYESRFDERDVEAASWLTTRHRQTKEADRYVQPNDGQFVARRFGD